MTRLAASYEQRVAVQININPQQATEIAKSESGESRSHVPHVPTPNLGVCEQSDQLRVCHRSAHVSPITIFVRFANGTEQVYGKTALLDAPICKSNGGSPNVVEPPR